MKSKIEIEGRLKKLRIRYLRKFINAKCVRSHKNCVYNYTHMPRPILNTQSTTTNLAPRNQVTLVVLQDPKEIGICMHGSDDCKTWNGDICDNDIISSSCNKFKFKYSEIDAVNEFEKNLEDDEYVLNNMPDIAALQWVLKIRVKDIKYTIFDKISLFFDRIINNIKRNKKIKPSQVVGELPMDVWNDPSKNT